MLVLTGCAVTEHRKDPGTLVCEALCDGCDECEMRCALEIPATGSSGTELKKPF